MLDRLLPCTKQKTDNQLGPSEIWLQDRGAGAWGFRDFPHLTRSEGESHWQLPDPPHVLSNETQINNSALSKEKNKDAQSLSHRPLD
jgi:hypothetical protein